MLDVANIDAFYGETQALFGPSLRIDEGEAAYFHGLTYKLTSEDELTIYLALHNDNGVQEMTFELHRVGN